jgi:putative RecB family exonuclease
MARTETFSFSRVTSFEQCPRRYRYRYVDGVREAFQSIEAFMGRQVHSTVEWMFAEKAGGRLPGAADCVRRYTEGFDRDWTAERTGLRIVREGTPLEQYRKAGAEMVADFHRARFVPDDLETVGLEQHFALDLAGGQRFQGFIDRLARSRDGLLHIIDYKTGARPPIRFEGKDAEQLEAYAVAMFSRWDADELELRLEYLRNGSTQRRRIARGDIAEVARRLSARIEAAATATVFPARPGVLCGWCGFNDLCDACPTTSVGRASGAPPRRSAASGGGRR